MAADVDEGAQLVAAIPRHHRRDEPGHRIQLILAGSNFPMVWPTPRPYTATLELGGPDGCRLVLPAVGPQEPALPPARVPPPESIPEVVRGFGDPPTCTIARDPLNGVVRVRRASRGRTRVDDQIAYETGTDATATASERDPARASLQAESFTKLHWPDCSIDTRFRGRLESTETALHLTLRLDIAVDGAPHHQRSWTRTYPRHLL